jgi:hypothetical protein
MSNIHLNFEEYRLAISEAEALMRSIDNGRIIVAPSLTIQPAPHCYVTAPTYRIPRSMTDRHRRRMEENGIVMQNGHAKVFPVSYSRSSRLRGEKVL